MKAAIISGKGAVRLEELPTPKIGASEVLVRMHVCGICGTDIEKIHGEAITPPILGHEVAGEVEAVGPNVRPFDKGDRICVHHHVSCGSCFYCKNGRETLCESYSKTNLDPCGFAEYFRVPETLVKGGAIYKLPDSMSFEEGSQVEPTACCIRALRMAGVKAGESVAVFGVGPMGLTHIQFLRLSGAAPVIAVDVLESRRNMARKFGADAAFDPSRENVPEALRQATDGRGVDYGIVATANPKAIEQASQSVRKGGKVVLFGAPARGAMVSLDVSQLFIREVAFQPSYSTSETEMRMALELIASKLITPSAMITHRFPLRQSLEAFKVAEDGTKAVKVIVQN